MRMALSFHWLSRGTQRNAAEGWAMLVPGRLGALHSRGVGGVSTMASWVWKKTPEAFHRWLCIPYDFQMSVWGYVIY